MSRIKTEWSALTRAQVVAAMARKGFAREDVRAAADLAYAQGYANVDSTDNSTRALIRYGHTEVDAWDVQTFALPVGKLRLPAHVLTVGMVFFLVGSNGVGRYRVTSVEHRTNARGEHMVCVDWQSAVPGNEWNQGGKGWNAGDIVTIDVDAAQVPANGYRSYGETLSPIDGRTAMARAHGAREDALAPGWACVDCTILHANGDAPQDMTETELARYLGAVDRAGIGYSFTLGLLTEEHADTCTDADREAGCDCEHDTFRRFTCTMCHRDTAGEAHAMTPWAYPGVHYWPWVAGAEYPLAVSDWVAGYRVAQVPTVDEISALIP